MENSEFSDTLRISDITMKRMLNILRILKEEKAIITSAKLVKQLHAIEVAEGYKFQVSFS